MAKNPMYEPFNVIDNIIYKTVGEAKIPLTALVPKNTPTGARPVIVRWHGGFWIGGERNYALMFPQWILDLAREQGAILLTVDYRLLPESSGDELLSDLASFMHWLPQNIDNALQTLKVKADLFQVLTTGESAGGWCAVQCALLHGTGIAGFPSRDSPVKLAAAISHYGVLDLECPFFTSTADKSFLFFPNPSLDALDKHIAGIKSHSLPQVCTGDSEPARVELIASTFVQCRIQELLGPGADKYPMQVLDKLTRKPPAIWAWHGTDDTIVPWYCSKVFVEKLKNTHPNANVKLTTVPGEHGLDVGLPLTEDWIIEGVTWTKEFWLDGRSSSL